MKKTIALFTLIIFVFLFLGCNKPSQSIIDLCGNGTCDTNESFENCSVDCNVPELTVEQIITTCIQPCVEGGLTFQECVSKCKLPKNLTDQNQDKCGDGVCNETENAHKNLCPRDCDLSLAGTSFTCQEGEFNFITKKCDVTPQIDYNCSRGNYDSKKNECVYSPQVIGVCEEGTLDSNTGFCITNPSTSYVCTGGTYDSNSGKCVVEPVAQIICSQGAYNESTQKCKKEISWFQLQQILILFPQ